MDLEKAIAYVQTRGDAIERARLAAILWDEPPPEAALQELAGPEPVLACFQPHGYGPLRFMRQALPVSLAAVLRPKDLFVPCPVYYAGGTTSFRPTAAEVAADCHNAGLPVTTVSHRSELKDRLDRGDLHWGAVLVMGARDPSLGTYAAGLAVPA